MAPKVYTWITLWFMLTAPLMIWDAGYCLMRPRSMVGGDLHWAWKLYDFYGQIDKVRRLYSSSSKPVINFFFFFSIQIYGVKAFEDGDGFANAAGTLLPRSIHALNFSLLLCAPPAILNLLENFAAITYLVLVYAFKSDIAPLFGYTGATVTLAKTILYLAQEYYCGWCAIGHNDFVDVLAYWVCPNVVWCTISSLTMYRLGNDIASSLRQRKTTVKQD
ncbi:uncharacterized protein EV420DRAFT_91975 [Desarmillaria tabescens]|uniref:Uncharacterized protein n=1 Tax=Armillaria tabescens TaxID=1929756 RepID=A0AA39NQR9_ARMTA|nr:uncharacterized protein EV420DRAFT_91975 [Desarmillaria tabescens]KAK0470137.1 hypothetical protein EV420DRAFT_91975 [Desarmillaria tabescens]